MDTPQDMQESTSVYCVACGSDLTSRPADRRSLQSAAAEHVVTALKEILVHMVDQVSDIDIDAVTEDSVRCGRMCRKCFSAYERYPNTPEITSGQMPLMLQYPPH